MYTRAMKFPTLDLAEQFLLKQWKENPSFHTLIISDDGYERETLLGSASQTKSFLLEEYEQVLFSSSLFDRNLRYCLSKDKVLKDEEKKILTLLKDRECPHTFFLAIPSLSVGAKKEVASLSNLILVEFEPTKPWDRPKKTSLLIHSLCKKQGKTIAHDAVQSISETLGHNSFLVAQEIEKLSIYLGEKTHISLNDVLIHSQGGTKQISWVLFDQIAQKEIDKALQTLHAFISEGMHPLQTIKFMRSQLHLILQISSLQAKGQKKGDIQPLFKETKPRAFDKAFLHALKNPYPVWKKMLFLIDELEMRFKNEAIDETLYMEKLLIDLCSIYCPT